MYLEFAHGAVKKAVTESQWSYQPTVVRLLKADAPAMPNARLTPARCSTMRVSTCPWLTRVTQHSKNHIIFPGDILDKLGIAISYQAICRSSPEQLSQIIATPVCPRNVNLVNRLDRAVQSKCRGSASVRELEPERRAGIVHVHRHG